MTTSHDLSMDPWMDPSGEFNSVNELMLRVDEINAKNPTELTEADIVVLIAYHRRNRAKKAAGIKPVRHKSAGGSALSLEELLNVSPVKLSTTPAAPKQLPAPTPATKPSGFRRI